jgi:hypothetical protein
MASGLPHPNRFYAAVGFAASPPLGSRAVTDETRLLLYALYQQVSHEKSSRTRKNEKTILPPQHPLAFKKCLYAVD